MSETILNFSEYQALVEQSPVLIWRANLSAECDYFNQRWLEFTGRTLAQETGNGWAEGVHKEDFDYCLKIYLDAFKKREAFEMRYRLKRADGQYRWINDVGTPMTDQKGEFCGYIGSCTDVTEQVVAERRLKEQREKELAELRGLLPICSYCKKIRDDGGHWHPLETYISQRAKADFSHGCCPGCSSEYLKS